MYSITFYLNTKSNKILQKIKIYQKVTNFKNKLKIKIEI